MIPPDALPVTVDLGRRLTLRDIGRLEAAGVGLADLSGPGSSRADLIAGLAYLALVAAGVDVTLDACRDLTLDDVALIAAPDDPGPTPARPAA